MPEVGSPKNRSRPACFADGCLRPVQGFAGEDTSASSMAETPRALQLAPTRAVPASSPANHSTADTRLRNGARLAGVRQSADSPQFAFSSGSVEAWYAIWFQFAPPRMGKGALSGLGANCRC